MIVHENATVRVHGAKFRTPPVVIENEFRLVDFKDILVWESQYEIKKEGRESGVYR